MPRRTLCVATGCLGLGAYLASGQGPALSVAVVAFALALFPRKEMTK